MATTTVSKGIQETWATDLAALDTTQTFIDKGTGQKVESGKMFGQLTTAAPLTGTTQKSTAGALAPDQTLLNATTSARTGVALSTTLPTTISTGLTVPPGQTGYITDIYFSGNTSNQFYCTVTGATDAFVGIAKGDTAPVCMTGIETQAQIAGGAAGQAITCVLGPVAAATNAWYDLHLFTQ